MVTDAELNDPHLMSEVKLVFRGDDDRAPAKDLLEKAKKGILNGGIVEAFGKKFYVKECTSGHESFSVFIFELAEIRETKT